VYQFDWAAQRTDADLGAFHAIDLPFTFDTFDVDGWDVFVGADHNARELGSAMRSAWATFARHGDPSCEAVGAWPRYESGKRSTMVLGADPRVVADPLGIQRSWWEGLWDPACRPAGVPV
jgi:para-nitrobenzyl esterase